MKNLIDTIFSPFISFLTTINEQLNHLSVPLNRPLDIVSYLNPFTILGTAWTSLIQLIISLTVLYFIVYVIVNGTELLQKFKNTIKWW